MPSEKLYKTLDEALIRNLSISCERHYYYKDDEEEVELVEKKIDLLSNDCVYKLEDSDRMWSIYKTTKPLFTKIKLSFSHIAGIYYGNTKVCFTDAVLGVGLEWKPKGSKIKRCVKLGELNHDMDCFDSNEILFEIKHPDSDIEFFWFLYIVKPGTKTSESQERLANTAGLILAREHLWTIVSSGNGSIFPIELCSKPNTPLWSIRCDFDDWSEEEFSLDNLSITLNKAHELYKKIDQDNEEYDPLVFKEVIGSAFYALISQIISITKDYSCFDDIYKEGYGEQGSILLAMKYFKDTLNFAIDGKPSKLINSIKEYLDKEASL